MAARLISITVLCLCLSSLANGFIQELTLHESPAENRNYYVIRDKVSDASVLPVQNVMRICFRGGWDLYLNIDFSAHGDGSNTADVRCVNESFPYKSFRHPGASDTDIDALSLYTGTWTGEEIYVDELPFSGNKIHVASIGFTGKSPLTLFQGIMFDGPSYCLQPDPRGFGWFVPADHGTTTVGSALKGCMEQSVHL